MGRNFGVLKVGFEHATDRILAFFAARFKVKNAYIDEVVQQSVKKKVLPAIERRIRTELTEKAEEGAIQLFSDNLRNLLLVAPLKGRVVLGFDPAFRTGAKLAVVDATGKMLTTSGHLSCQTSLCSSNRRSQERFGRLDWSIRRGNYCYRKWDGQS